MFVEATDTDQLPRFDDNDNIISGNSGAGPNSFPVASGRIAKSINKLIRCIFSFYMPV